MNQLIGYLLYRVNYHSNRTFAETGQTMEENGDFTATAKLLVNETIAMQSYLDLIKHDLRFLKAILDDKVHAPNTTDVLRVKKCLRPDLNECRDSRGIMINSRGDVVIRTVQRLIGVAKSQGKQIPQTRLYKEKTGHDEAGTMSIYHSHNNPHRESNIFSKLFTPLNLISTLTGNVLWKNEAPNSSKTTRPLTLIAEKETADLLSFVNTTFEPEENQLHKDGVQFEYEGVKYKVLVEIRRSMKDFKIRQVESRLHGVHCLLCYSPSPEWKDIHKIESGFPIERTASGTIELYKEILDEYGEVKRRVNDYETRKGFASKPLSENDHHDITITHQYIHLTNRVLKIMYHFQANVLKWTETEKDKTKAKIEKVRENVLWQLEENTGLQLDQTNSQGSKQGTSTTGEQGRHFFLRKIDRLLLNVYQNDIRMF